MTYRSYLGDPTPTAATRNETWGYPQTLMMLDIAALQKIYGANFSFNAGDSVYTWSPTTGEMFDQRRRPGRAGNGAAGEPHLHDDLGRRRQRHLRPVELQQRRHHRPAARRMVASTSQVAARQSRRRPFRPRQCRQRPAVRGRHPLADRECDRRRRHRHADRQPGGQPLTGGGGTTRSTGWRPRDAGLGARPTSSPISLRGTDKLDLRRSTRSPARRQRRLHLHRHRRVHQCRGPAALPGRRRQSPHPGRCRRQRRRRLRDRPATMLRRSRHGFHPLTKRGDDAACGLPSDRARAHRRGMRAGG